MSDRGEYLGEGYVKGMGRVHIFHDMSSTKRLVVQPVGYDGGETSVNRDRVRWRKSKKNADST